ncbi:MAG: hypothetical protein AAF638_10965 [Pseudomonadota bacterium]
MAGKPQSTRHHDDIIGGAYQTQHGAQYTRAAVALSVGDQLTLHLETEGEQQDGVVARRGGIGVGRLSPQIARLARPYLKSARPLYARVDSVVIDYKPFETATFVGVTLDIPVDADANTAPLPMADPTHAKHRVESDRG